MKHTGLKRLLALFMALVMCFSLLPASAFADSGEEGDFGVEDEFDPALEEGGWGADPCEHEPLEAVTENESAPTCTEPGSHDAVVYCALCGAELSRETVEDPAPGHTPEAVGAIPSSCSISGHTAGVVCAVCGEVLEGCEELPLAEHVPEDVHEVPAEPGKPGTAAGVVCAVCGEILEGCEEIEALPEDADAGELEGVRVRVVFACEPENTTVTVYECVEMEAGDEAYSAMPDDVPGWGSDSNTQGTHLVVATDENGEPVVIQPEADGSYLLLPGDYLYDAACEGYVTVEGAVLHVLRPGETDLSANGAGEYGIGQETQTMHLTLEADDESSAPKAGSVAINKTNFPDATLRNYVTNNYDMDRDGSLSSTELSKAWYMDVKNKGISSMKGIEKLTGLVFLDCSYNGLSSLDLSKNTRLGGLHCEHNQLTKLDLSGLSNLAVLWCWSNSFTTLDIRPAPLLEEVFLSGTKEAYGTFTCFFTNHSDISADNRLKVQTSEGTIIFCEGQNYPIIVIPGIMGSRLLNSNGTVVWPNAISLGNYGQLSYNNELFVPQNNRTSLFLVNETSKEYGSLNTYESLVEYLRWAFPNRAVYFFSYDWRQKNADSADELRKSLEDLKIPRANFVCHSMGGLVFSHFIAQGNKNKVERALILGTPYEGATRLLEASLTINSLAGSWYDPFANLFAGLRGMSVNLKRGLPGVAELCPTQDFQDSSKKKVYFHKQMLSAPITVSVDIPSTVFSLYTLKTWLALPSISSNARHEKERIENYLKDLESRYGKENILGFRVERFGENQVKIYFIYKIGISYNNAVHDFFFISPVPGQWDAKAGYTELLSMPKVFFAIGDNRKTMTGADVLIGLDGNAFALNDVKEDWGDGTVPLASANMAGNIESRVRFFNTNHSGLAGGAPSWFEFALSEMEAFIQEAPKLERWINYALGKSDDAADTGRTSASGSAKKAYKKVKIACPVIASISYGGETLTSDPDNFCDVTSFGRMYLLGEDGESKLFFLDWDVDYDVVMEASDEGTMDFSIQQCDGDDNILEEREALDVPLTETTVVTTDTDLTETTILRVDENGDGTEDREIVAVPVEGLTDPLRFDREYLAMKPGDTAELTLTVDPVQLSDGVEWAAVDSDNILLGEDPIITVDAVTHTITACRPGTAYAIAYVACNDRVYYARCRVDVVANESGSETPIADDVTINGVRLPLTAAIIELYRSDCGIEIPVELILSQNNIHADGEDDDHGIENIGKAITGASFVNTELDEIFSLRVKDDRTLVITPKPEYVTKDVSKLTALSSSYRSAFKLTVEGVEHEKFTTPEQLTITLKRSEPKLKATNVKFNSFLSEDRQSLSVTGGVVTNVVKSDPEQMPWVRADGLDLVYQGEEAGKLSGKLSLLATVEGWSLEWPVTVSVSAVRTAPKLTAKPNSLTLKPNSYDTATTILSAAPVEAFSDYRFSVVDGPRNEADEPLLEYGFDSYGRILTVHTTEAFDDTAAHTYKVILGLCRPDEEEPIPGISMAVTVKTLPEKTAVTLSAKAAGTIDTGISESPIMLTASMKNFHAENVERFELSFSRQNPKTKIWEDLPVDTPLRAVQSGESFTVTQAGEIEQGWVYYANLCAKIGEETWVDAKPVKLNIKFTDPAKVRPSVTLKASGAIDVIRPDTAVTLTPTIKNCYTHTPAVGDLQILRLIDGDYNLVTGTEDDPFVVQAEDGVFLLKLKTGAVVDPKTDKLKVRFNAEMDGTGVFSSEVSVSLKMGKAKVAQSAKTVTLLKTDRYDRAVIRLTPDAGLSEIDHVVMVSPKDKNGREAFELIDLGGSEYAIGYRKEDREGFAEFGKPVLPESSFKGGTVKLQVFLEGNISSTPNATVSVKVNLG